MKNRWPITSFGHHTFSFMIYSTGIGNSTWVDRGKQSVSCEHAGAHHWLVFWGPQSLSAQLQCSLTPTASDQKRNSVCVCSQMGVWSLPSVFQFFLWAGSERRACWDTRAWARAAQAAIHTHTYTHTPFILPTMLTLDPVWAIRKLSAERRSSVLTCDCSLCWWMLHDSFCGLCLPPLDRLSLQTPS